MPGKRVECFTIKEIKPNRCIGYKNVIVHCAINDLKHSAADVDDVFVQLVDKLNVICQLCPEARVIVSPALPSKLNSINSRVIKFNYLLFNYIRNINPRINTLDFSMFCDENNNYVLHDYMGRYKRPYDYIHLGSTGIFTLSRVIRDKIFSHSVDSRRYSHVVSPGAVGHSWPPLSNSRNVTNSHYDDY